MIPLLEFRDYVGPLRDEPGARMDMKRNGLATDGQGPFTFETRAEILKRVLEIELATGLEVISRPELSAIQLQWNYDGGFNHRVSDIYFQVKKISIAMSDNDLQVQREEEENNLLNAVAASHGAFVVAEGRYHSPALAAKALLAGADAVVAGSAITRTEHVTGWFVAAMQGQSGSTQGGAV